MSKASSFRQERRGRKGGQVTVWRRGPEVVQVQAHKTNCQTVWLLPGWKVSRKPVSGALLTLAPGTTWRSL